METTREPIQDETGDIATAEPRRTGYQGQPGSFGARAAVRFGTPAAYPGFAGLLDALVSREVDSAVLPVSTLVSGALTEPLEALARLLSAAAPPRLSVTAEIEVPVRLVLAATRGTELAGLREVLSQGAVLAQCRSLLARLGASAVETSDTAGAAMEVARLGGPRAAVCSEEAALEAGLVLLEEDVSDVRPNATRFWRLTSWTEGEPPSGETRRVVFFTGPRTLAALAERGAEVLALPSAPLAPVRGFAEVPERSLPSLMAALKGAKNGDRAVWLGPPPEVPRPPRVASLPRVSEVREASVVRVGPLVLGGGHRAVIAGPCAVESEEQVFRLARAVARAGATGLRGGVFKPRTSPYAFQGHGLVALGWMKAAGEAVGLPIVTEIMAPAQVGPVAEKADMLQIGARNCQNYDLLKEAAGAGRPVLLKRGFGTTVDEWLASAEYLLAGGCAEVALCERGIRTFEQATRGTLDVCGLLAARGLTHLPILADPSHAAGRRELVPGLARAAWGAGADGLIVEVHDTPESASCDGPQALLPEDLEALCDELGLLPGPSGSVERVRRAIDSVDREIGRLVTRRLDLCRLVAEAKRTLGVPIRDAAREAQVKARFARALGIDEAAAEGLADALIALGLRVEGWREEEPGAPTRR